MVEIDILIAGSVLGLSAGGTIAFMRYIFARVQRSAFDSQFQVGE